MVEIERRADTLDIELKAAGQQNEIQRKQLLDKIQQQYELIAAEKDSKEVWIRKYELEQKGHVETHTSYMKLRSEMQEKTI